MSTINGRIAVLLAGTALVSASGATAQATLSGSSVPTVGGAVSPEPVAASPQEQRAQPASTGESADIVVTAQKREQNIQDVPIAVQVVTADTLQANGVRDFSGLNRVAPSLVVRPAENPVNASVSIRGIGTFAFSIGVEPSVAVQVDDVPIAFQARAFADLSDISRIEVLRGPQSTLYGKSASAGLINIVTPGPTSTLTARVGGLTTTDDQYAINGVISGPLTSTLGFRSTVNYDDFKGNIKNLTTGKTINGQWIFSTRNKLVWDPTDNLNVSLGIDYIKGRTTVGRPIVALSPDARLRNIAAYSPSVLAPGVTFDRDNQDVYNDYLGGTKYHDFAQSLRLSYDTGGPTVMSITAHDKYFLSDTLDWDESAIPATYNTQAGTFEARQWSQEFRLVSPGKDRFRYTLGLFYADVNYIRDFMRGPIYALSNLYATASNTNKAAFGQLEYDVLPSTTLIGGLRVGQEKVAYTIRIRLNGTYFSGDDTNTFSTYKVGIQQKLGEDVMVFASRATGYKGESYDLGTGFNQARADAGPVRPERSLSHEIGIRSQFLDRRLTLNVTGFTTTYRDFQAQGIDIFPDGTTNFRLANVGKLRTRGIEVEAAARIGQQFNISTGVTYLDADILDFPGAQCFPGQSAAQGCTGTPARQNLAGGRPAQAPTWKYTINADYTQPISTSLEAVGRVAYTYQSKINYSLSQDPATIQPGYGLVNLSLGLRDTDRRFEVTAFVNNLFDKQYLSNINNQFANYGNQTATLGYLPRDFRRYGGIRATYNF